MSKQLIAIWAEAHNHVIGKNHTMPWHLPAELAHFKKTTMGSAILMGRVTFDGMNRRCLPGRETLILTRDKDFDCEGVTTVTSVEGDTYFPQLDMTAFKEVSCDRVAKDDKNAYDFSISRYEKEGD